MKKNTLHILMVTWVLSACAQAVNPDNSNLSAPTWHQDVAPLVAQHCASCHSADNIGSFLQFNDYATAKTLSSVLAAKVESREMPPFLAGETKECQPRHTWKDDPLLSEHEVALFVDWAASGALKGDPTNPAPLPNPTKKHLGEPYTVFTPDNTFTTPSEPGIEDELICYVLEPELNQRQRIKALKVIPDSITPVPHTPTPNSHPRLLFNADELEVLRARAQQEDWNSITEDWEAVVATYLDEDDLPANTLAGMPTVDAEWRQYAETLTNLSLAWAILQDEAARDQALEAMRRYTNLNYWGTDEYPKQDLGAGHTIYAYAIGIDVLWQQVDADTREQWVERLRDATSVYYSQTQLEEPVHWSSLYNGNHCHNNWTAIYTAGVVLENEIDEASAWVEDGITTAQAVLKFWDPITDGSHQEGVSYSSYGNTYLFSWLHILKRRGEIDYSGNRWLSAHVEFLVYSSLLDDSEVLSFADGTRGYYHGPQNVLYFLEAHRGDGLAAGLASRLTDKFHEGELIGNSRHREIWQELLWYSPDFSAVTPEQAGLGNMKTFEDMGLSVWRNGWGATDSLLATNMGPPGGRAALEGAKSGDSLYQGMGFSHEHPDAGSLIFYPGGKRVLTDTYYIKPKRTSMENSLTFIASEAMLRPYTIEQAANAWGLESDTFVQDIGDPAEVGQIGEWKIWMGGLDDMLEHDVDTSLLVAAESDGVVLVSAELSGVYPDQFPTESGQQDLGLERLSRSVLRLPGDQLVIIDWLKTSQPLTPVAWFHNTFYPFSLNTNNGADVVVEDNEKWTLDPVYPGTAVVELRNFVRLVDKEGDPTSSVRVEQPKVEGQEAFVYLLHSELSEMSGLVLDLQDELLTLSVMVDGITWTVKLASSTEPAVRQANLGLAGVVAEVSNDQGFIQQF